MHLSNQNESLLNDQNHPSHLVPQIVYLLLKTAKQHRLVALAGEEEVTRQVRSAVWQLLCLSELDISISRLAYTLLHQCDLEDDAESSVDILAKFKLPSDISHHS